MNLLNHYVIEELSEPKKITTEYNTFWKKDIMVECYGRKEKTTVSSLTKEGIDKYVKGYVYLA